MDRLDIAKKNELQQMLKPQAISESLANFNSLSEAREAQEALRTYNEAKNVDTNLLERKVRNGEEISPKDLHLAVLFGTDETKKLIRSALISPAAVARNQDLVLPHIKAALGGNPDSRNFIEKHRLIIEEAIPSWFKPIWDKTKNAAFRKLDLHTKNVRRAVKKINPNTWIEKKYKAKYLPPLSASSIPSDIRTSSLTFGTRIGLLDFMETEVSALPYSKENLFQTMKKEVEKDLIGFSSPTIIGKHFRKAASIEARHLFTARLIDDVCLWHDLPLSDVGKQRLWEQTREDPWSIASHPLVEQRLTIFKILADSGVREDDLNEHLDQLADPLKLAKLLRDHKKELRKNEVAEANSSDSKRTVAEPKQDRAAGETRSTRLALLAVLETYSPSSESAASDARKLDKLIGGKDDLLTMTINRLYQGDEPEAIITELRKLRPMSALHPKKKIAQDAEALSKPISTSSIQTEEAIQREVIYAEAAIERMQDGRLRHATTLAIEKFLETPELIDRSKIRATEDVWEIRLVKQGIRIYYREPGDHKLEVLLVGLKRDQKSDLRKL